MAHPTITDRERVETYVVSSSTDTFPVEWPVFPKDGDETDVDVDVYVDGVLQAPSTWTFSGTFKDGIAAKGNVVLDAAIASGTVRIVGNIPGERSGDFSPGTVKPASLDTEFDKIWARLRELELQAKRAPKIPPYEADSDETPVDQAIPDLADRASVVAGYDSNGRPAVSTSTLAQMDMNVQAGGVVAPAAGDAHKGYVVNGAETAVITQRVAFTVATLSDLKAIIPTSELTAYMEGRDAAGDAGFGYFRWDSASSDTADDGITVLPTGHVGAGRWKRIYTGPVWATWYGAGLGGADDGPEIQAAYDAAVALEAGTHKSVTVYLPRTTDGYKIGTQVNVNGRASAIVGDPGYTPVEVTADIVAFSVTVREVTISGLLIWANTTIGNRSGTGIYLHGSTSRHNVTGCLFDGLDKAVLISGAWVVNIDHNWIKQCDTGLLAYRRTDEDETTTLNIVQNYFVNNDTWNLNIGDESAVNWASGFSATVVNVKNNALDNTQNRIANASVVNIEGNFVELNLDPMFLVHAPAANGFIEEIRFRNNVFNGLSSQATAIRVDGKNIERFTAEGNRFNNLGAGIDLTGLDNTAFKVELKGNYYNLVTAEVLYPFNRSTDDVASQVWAEADDDAFDKIENGQITLIRPDVPTTGRLKRGSKLIRRQNLVGNAGVEDLTDFVAFFDCDRRGFSRLDADSDTANAVAATNVVTPTDITKYRIGDRITIAGAGVAGANLTSNVDTIDYVAGTLTVKAGIDTDVTAASVTWATGQWVYKIRSVNIADDATETFHMPFERCIVHLLGSTEARSGVLFVQANSSITLMAGTGTDLQIGTTTNPDIDIKVNLWTTADTLHIKNRMGSALDFTVRLETPELV